MRDSDIERGPVILSYGLGVDSTSILLRWLEEPDSRWFALSDLVVITAMTGDEWQRTGALVEAHVLPRLAAHGVRFVQVARGGLSRARDGIVVLDDSASPRRLHLEGHYKLSDELLAAGTVPQMASGQRRCSIKAKGEVLDAAIHSIVGEGDFTHVIGFESGEGRRATRDQGYGTRARHTRYPLIEWGWDRTRCSEYIAEVTGVTDWPKSACVYCPFAANKANVAGLLARFRSEPEAAVLALRVEHRARALNERMRLFGRRSVEDLLKGDGNLGAIRAFDIAVAGEPWALYEVRRVLMGARRDPAKFGHALRHTAVLYEGTEAGATACLAQIAVRDDLAVEVSGHIARAWVRHRGTTFPAAEHFYVVAPAGIAAKSRPGFERRWSEVTGEGRLFASMVA